MRVTRILFHYDTERNPPKFTNLQVDFETAEGHTRGIGIGGIDHVSSKTIMQVVEEAANALGRIDTMLVLSSLKERSVLADDS